MRGFALFAFVGLFCLLPARADILDAIEDAKKFEVPAGFKVEAAAAEPQLANPVAISMDNKGRMWVAETYRLDNAVVDITKNTNWLRSDLSFRVVGDRARFLTNALGTNATILTRASERLNILGDFDHDGVFETNQVMRSTFRKVESGLAAGVLAHNDQVFFACIPNLWSFDFQNPTNPIVKSIATGFGVHIGVTGHDLHGLTIGMDGKLYFSMGDRGFVVRSTKGTFATPDTGAILRCSLDGSELEVVAVGLRNPQDLTFDALGNLWTADNDTAGEDKSRLIHVVEGADYGWRCSYQHMKNFGPWVGEKLWEGKLDGTLPTCGEPAQGPAGIAYYPGTGLTPEFDGRFLLCDFPGGIQSFTVEPRGASYVIKDKRRFLWGAWPTDIEFGTDGSLYFSDWVSGWSLPYKGRIYRITHPDAQKDPNTIDTANILREGFENRPTTNLLTLLEHRDLRVRQGAHLVLAHRKTESGAPLRALATDASKSRFARLHAIWALRMQGAVEPAIVEKLLADQDPEIRAQSIASAPAGVMLKMFADESPRVRFYAATAYQTKLLFDSNNSLAAQAMLDLLEKNNDEDPYLTHAGVRLLAYSSPALQRAKRHTSLAVRRAAMLAERSIASQTIGNYLKDPDLGYEAARAINDAPIGSAFPQLAALLTNNCPTNIMTRAINVNFRIGGTLPAKRLANFAAGADAPTFARVDALDCLAQWQEPDELDRVVGLYRPIAPNVNTRPAAFALAALEPHWTNLLSDVSEPVAIAALACVRELAATNVLPRVLAVFNAPERPAAVRAAALDTLRELDDTNFTAAIEAALADKDLRRIALKFVQTNATSASIRRVVELVSATTDVPTFQAALAMVARLEPADALEPLRSQLQRLANKQTPPELGLDLLETAKHYPVLKDAADAAATKAFTDPASEPLLAGGDVNEGRKTFKERSDVACMRCHVAEGVGGSVGPALDGIGGRQSRAYILESILQPNKVIAPGFDNISIGLNNDSRRFVGALVRETGATIQIMSPEDGLLTFRKNDIRLAVHTDSAMPEGLGQLLSPFELRNLIEYISSLK